MDPLRTHSRSLSVNHPRSINRRTFLHHAVIGASAPLILSTAAKALGRPAAGDRLTLGVIGMGKRGHNVMRSFMSHKEVQVVAISEVEPTRLEFNRQFVDTQYSQMIDSGAYKGCTTYTDFRDLLERKDIDAVLIATPDHWHAIPAIRAANAGMDIFCEKPLSLTIHEARMMANAAKANNVVFQTGSQQRSECGGRFHRACELVRNGRIGKLTKIIAGVGGPSRPCDLPGEPMPEGVHWDMWLGQAPERPYNQILCPQGVHDHYPAWRDFKEYSGGGMTDWGAHHFDIAQWALDMDGSGPVEIIPPELSDEKLLTYVYANGVKLVKGEANGVKFIGTEGTIEVNRDFFQADPEELAKDPIGENEIHLYKANNHVGNFLECVRSRQDPICTAEIGARSVTVCHLGNMAFWSKRKLRWNPTAERFIDDAEADTWLDRERRDPWKDLA